MKDFLSTMYEGTPDILEEYISHWSLHHVPKKTIMTAPGEVERYMYFVVEGVQKSYHEKDEKVHIISFTYPPSFSGIPESFLTQTPSNYFLETITESTFLRLSYDKHQELMKQHREIETLFRKTAEHFAVGMIQRHYELMAFDIEGRYQAFAKRSKHLFGVISHKDIASYLRIDKTNFSKLFNSSEI